MSMDDPPTPPFPEVLAYLRQKLGAHMTAYVAGVEHPKQLELRSPDGGTAARLMATYVIVHEIVARYDATTAQAWLFGTNSALDEQAPAEVLRGAEEESALAAVRRAARLFLDA